MSAVFAWSESNGGGEAVTDSPSNLNFGSLDAPNLTPATYPIVGGENSYEKYIRAKFTGTFTEISSMKFWKLSGAYKTGEDIHCAGNVAYTAPVATTSVVATVTIPTTEGTAIDVQSTEGDTTKLTVIGTYTKYLCLQLQSTVSTPGGAVNTKSFKFKYNEV